MPKFPIVSENEDFVMGYVSHDDPNLYIRSKRNNKPYLVKYFTESGKARLQTIYDVSVSLKDSSYNILKSKDQYAVRTSNFGIVQSFRTIDPAIIFIKNMDY